MQQIRGVLLTILIGVLAACSVDNAPQQSSRGANKYLWNAALETLSFLPLEQADPFSGLIVTGWGTAEGSGQQYRATVLVNSERLTAQSLKVAVFRRSSGREVPAAQDTVTAVENAILFRARELRIGERR